MLGGVLGGFAEYIGIDPIWVRLGFVFFALIGYIWSALLIYIVGVIIIPDGSNMDISDKKVKTTSSGYLIIGVGLIFFGLMFFINQFFNIDIWNYIRGFYYNFKYYIGAIVLIVLGIIIIIRGKG